MQVVTVENSAGQTRYYLANDDGTPVEPVSGGRNPPVSLLPVFDAKGRYRMVPPLPGASGRSGRTSALPYPPLLTIGV